MTLSEAPAHVFARKGKNKAPIMIGDRKGSLVVIGESFPVVSKSGKISYSLPVRCDCSKEYSLAVGNFLKPDSGLRCRSCANVRTGDGYRDVTGKKMWSYKKGAEYRNIKWDITAKDIYEKWEAQFRTCALTGIEIAWSNNTASVDRIDSKKGYSTDNIQIVHKDLNRMKNAFSQEYFISICLKVARLHG